MFGDIGAGLSSIGDRTGFFSLNSCLGNQLVSLHPRSDHLRELALHGCQLSAHDLALTLHLANLPLYSPKGSECKTHTETADNDQKERQNVIDNRQYIGSTPRIVLGGCVGCVVSGLAGALGGAILCSGYLDWSVRRQWGGACWLSLVTWAFVSALSVCS